MIDSRHTLGTTTKACTRSGSGSTRSSAPTRLDVDLLQELLYGIDALVRVHVWRETGVPLEPPEARGRTDV